MTRSLPDGKGAMAPAANPDNPRPLRLWPGVVVVLLQGLSWLLLPLIAPEVGSFSVLAGPLGLLLILVWWIGFSRASWLERLGAVLLVAVGMVVTPSLLHPSIRTGNMGAQFFIYAPWSLSLGLVGWAVVGRRLPTGPRRAAMVLTLLLASGGWALLRSRGLTGEGAPQLTWRWARTAEQQLLAQGEEPVHSAEATWAQETTAAWPGFRGPRRDSSVSGLTIATDWLASPPVELWRRPVGPAVSSLAVCGGVLYTQEQRGDDEMVTAYSVATGEPVWRHRDPVRHWDSHVGAGPRGTPACDGTRVAALGATGLVNVLDAASGSRDWSRDAASDAGATVPDFGFTASPLLLEDAVIVAVGGRLVAYDLASGDLRWTGPAGGGGYSSPELLTLDGVSQVVLLSRSGATAVAPADGRPLWDHPWPGDSYLQPALLAGGDLLIGEIDLMPRGMLRLAVRHDARGWTAVERWRSTGLKPHFSDFVVHQGQAYGFDGGILACIDLTDGQRLWKGGRYGHGQMLLLKDQDLLLVVTEQGGLALVAASPDRFHELARIPALDGRTWNHPALAGDVLLVRNGQEMAAFRLPRPD